MSNQTTGTTVQKECMKDENMLKKKDFDDVAVAAALRRGHRQRLYFEQIAIFRHKFMNNSGYRYSVKTSAFVFSYSYFMTY